MNSLKLLAEKIKKANTVIILCHVGPDGDSIGSMVALYHILTDLNFSKKVDMAIQGKIPDIYQFLPGVTKIKNLDDSDLHESYDLAIAVDCGAIDRLGEATELFKNAKTTVNIDHHISNNYFAEINVIRPEASAVGEILVYLAEELKVSLTKEIATNLYTSILTDTGGFKFDNTTPKTFEIAGKLLHAGAKPGYIYKKCYESKPLQMVKLQSHCVDNAVFTFNNRIAYTFVTRKMINDFQSSDDHVDGISEILRQINSVEVSMVLKETTKGTTKISFRSKKIDVCQIAKFFGGGGHRLAAGCTIEKTPVEALEELLPIVKKQLNK